MISVHTPKSLHGSVRIPSSKPHSQRALLLAMLAEGESQIHNINICAETQLIANAAQAFGATLQYNDLTLKMRGVGGKLHQPTRILNVERSGFALRNVLAIASLAEGPTILTGNHQLGQRPLLPLIELLTQLGARIEPITSTMLPLVNWGGGLTGGTLTVPGEETSQFATAILLASPYASNTLVVRLAEGMVGKEYIHMNIALMKEFGAAVVASEELTEIEVHSSGYTARELFIGADVTSLFSFIAAAVIVETNIHVEGVYLGVDPLLDESVTIGRRLGVHIIQTSQGVQILSGTLPSEQVVLSVAHIPTIVPALAALACSLPCGLRVTGAQHIRFHKTSRLATMMAELEKLGCHLMPIYQEEVLDGFEAPGQLIDVKHKRAHIADSHGDHRLFMALFLACLRLPWQTHLIGEELLTASFPQFVTCFNELGVPVQRNAHNQ